MISTISKYVPNFSTLNNRCSYVNNNGNGHYDENGNMNETDGDGETVEYNGESAIDSK